MVLSTCCCSLAWRVEVHRLKILNDEGLQGKLNDRIPMSIFWLAPQFCLLSLTGGLALNGLNKLLRDQLPELMQDYVSAINGFVMNGIGSFLNILCVHANKNLLDSTLNHSCLDKFYMRISIIGFVNLCYYWNISTMYKWRWHPKVD